MDITLESTGRNNRVAKHFLIYTNKHKDPKFTVTGLIEQKLLAKGQRVTVRVMEKDWKASQIQEEVTIPKDADCMLVLGGDGTVLQAARETIRCRIPLIGVNLGSLGFMTQIEPSNLDEDLDRLIQGDYRQESRMMLQGSAVLGNGQIREGLALNDIVITRSGPLRVIKLKVSVNGMFLHEYQADGMIVTTPTGSTGYNLSAGGPLVEPGAQLMMLTPICPHTLNQRSIILSADDEVEIEIPKGKEGESQTVEASLDGAMCFPMTTGDRIRVKRSRESAEFIRLGKRSFLEILHQKMNE